MENGEGLKRIVCSVLFFVHSPYRMILRNRMTSNLSVSGFVNNGYRITQRGGHDNYNGKPILFLDEFRGQIRYSTLLSMLQGYKQRFHARSTNILVLWKRVVYHYKEGDEFCMYAERMDTYTSYEYMKLKAHGKADLAANGFLELTENEQLRLA
ncbi:MAG: hypothetical protein K2O03_14945 [Lachnospiraceae bacterium]|nr:hypothetical protein [Lachnospiraceae bacterium]